MTNVEQDAGTGTIMGSIDARPCDPDSLVERSTLKRGQLSNREGLRKRILMT